MTDLRQLGEEEVKGRQESAKIHAQAEAKKRREYAAELCDRAGYAMSSACGCQRDEIQVKRRGESWFAYKDGFVLRAFLTTIYLDKDDVWVIHAKLEGRKKEIEIRSAADLLRLE